MPGYGGCGPGCGGAPSFFGMNNLILFLLLIILVGDCLCGGDFY
ncbi:hypothetical protein R9X47_18435 [Wukongibacter baidiensis]